MAKNVLIIAFHYPPESNGGVQRPYSFAKYLNKLGYHTYVVTTDCFGNKGWDEEKKIYRIPAFHGNLQGKNALRKFYVIVIKVIRKLIYLIGFLTIKDYKWFYNTRHEMGHIISETKPDVILATFSPLTNLLIGLAIKKKYEIPLVIDFRDGFLFEGLIKFNFIQKIVAKNIERKIIRNSDAVITISPPLSNYFKKNYDIKNVTTIYNGFDVDDLNSIRKYANERLTSYKFRMIYFGGFGSSRKRGIKPLLQALNDLKKSKTISSENFELMIYGKLKFQENYQIKKVNLGDVIKYRGYIERSLGLKIMQTQCDALLFYGAPGVSSVVSTKLLEYLFMNKPILGICKGNEAEKIIEITKTGLTVGFSVYEIIEGLKSIINYHYNPDWDEINKFSRETQTIDLINVIRQITNNEIHLGN